MMNRINLAADVNVTGAEQLDKVANGYRDIKNESLETVRAQQEAEREAQRKMPGFYGTGAINGNNNSSLNQFSGSRETAQEIVRLKATIENLNRNIEKANSEISKSNEKGNARDTFNWTSSLNQMEEAKQRAQNELKRLEASEKDKGIEALVKDRKAQMYSQAWNYAIQGANIYNGYRTSIANGDYLGAGANAKDQIGSAAMGLGGSLMSAGGMVAASGVGAIPGLIIAGVGALTMGTGGILKLISGDEKADIAEATAYENSLASLNAFNKRYNASGDYRYTDALRERATELAKGTGLSTYDFLDTALQQTNFGISQEEALSRTKMATMWAQATGADLSTIQSVLGLSSRMGKETDTSFLARAREAGGLNKAQTNEFLQGLQTVIEDGISKGYNKSTEDAAKNFAMFSGLSGGNPLWEGKYAAQKISTMSNTIAGATNLGDINQVLTIEAARKAAGGMDDEKFSKLMGFGKTGTYLDAMLMAENGLTPEMFKEIGKTINDLEGGNLTARVERWKSMSGLNYKGAIELDKMYRENPNMDDTAIQSKINSMKADPNYQSEETRKMNYINSIDSNVQKIGQSKFWDNFGKLEGVDKDYQNTVAALGRPAHYGNAVTVTGDGVMDVDKAIKDSGFQQLVRHGGLPIGHGGTTLSNLMTARANTYNPRTGTYSGGNDEFDKLFKAKLARYAALDDGKISQDELRKSLRAHDSKEMQAVYNSGNRDAYIAALEEMFKRLFTNMTITSS